MDKNQATAVPVRNNSTRAASARLEATRPSAPESSRGKKPRRLASLAVIAAVVLLVSAGAAYLLLGLNSPVDKSKYQAVFLNNGQVYFGKLSGWGGGQPTLTDVYYFQADTTTTPAEGDDSQVDATSTQTLVKLGEEIHKPSDKLILNRDSILFVENIEDDGQVVEAIKKNQQNKD